MSKHKFNHDTGYGLKSVQYGHAQGFGPLFNVRHPKKYKPVPLDKEAAPGVTSTQGGKETQQDT